MLFMIGHMMSQMLWYKANTNSFEAKMLTDK
jgi:hypothetical protein